jgi:polysaccharide export outer membrane protein
MLAALIALCMFVVPAAAQQPAAPADYVVGAEDVLTITVRDVPECSGDFLVRADGRVTIPIAGEVTVAGLTTAMIEQRLRDALRREIRDPQVTVNVKTMRTQRIYVMGAVRTPGTVDWKPNWRITEVVAAAGGLLNGPERTRAILFRTGANNITVDMRKVLVDADAASNIDVRPGDVINFQSDIRIRVNVIGQVARPGQVELLEGQGVVEAVAAAGGQKEDARLTGAVLSRQGKDIPLNLYEAIVKGQPQQNQPLREGDTVYVPQLLNRISVIGMVSRQGPVTMPDGESMSLTRAIGLAGGPSQTAKLDGVTIIRRVAPDRVTTTQVNYQAIVRGQKGAVDPLLENGDVVFIPQSGKAGTRDITSVLGVLAFPLRLFGI